MARKETTYNKHQHSNSIDYFKVTDLDKPIEMIVFVFILATFAASFIS